MNDGYMPVVPHCNGDQIRQPPIRRSAAASRSACSGLHVLPADLLPYVPLFARALLETGAGQQDFVSLSQRIGRATGGIRPQVWISAVLDSRLAAARLFLRAKAVPEKAAELLAILSDVLLGARLDNQERLHQLVLEEKATKESSLVPAGSHFVGRRLRANLHEADWADEHVGGISYLQFLRSSPCAGSPALTARIIVAMSSQMAAIRLPRRGAKIRSPAKSSAWLTSVSNGTWSMPTARHSSTRSNRTPLGSRP